MARIYLSGPMTGLPDFNRPTFRAAARDLREAGHRVYNPAEFAYEGEFPARRAFAEYCRFICLEADVIALLPGWGASVGVRAEMALAHAVGLAEWRLGLTDGEWRVQP